MSNKHRLNALLLDLTHQWGRKAPLNLNLLHDTLNFRIAKRRGVPFIGHGMGLVTKPQFSEDDVYAEFQLLLFEWEKERGEIK
jgi:hypothetical protein